MADPDLQISGGGGGGQSSRPSDKGRGGRGSLGPQFGLNIRGGEPLPWICHCFCIVLQSTLSKMDTFGTSTKCPSKRNVHLIESQRKGKER